MNRFAKSGRLVRSLIPSLLQVSSLFYVAAAAYEVATPLGHLAVGGLLALLGRVTNGGKN